MNHAWVGGGSPPPNSAVPLLPAHVASDAGQRGAGALRHDQAHQRAQRVALRGGERGAGLPRVGGEQARRAPAALGDRRRDAAPSTAGWRGSRAGRSSPPRARPRPRPGAPGRPRPGARARARARARSRARCGAGRRVRGGARAPRRRCCRTRAKSRLNGTAPSAPPSKFLNCRPPTSIVGGQLTVSPTSSPSRSSAAVDTTLNVDPGAYVPSRARL